MCAQKRQRGGPPYLKEKSIPFLSDSLLGVLKNDYDEKAMRAENWNRRCPT